MTYWLLQDDYAHLRDVKLGQLLKEDDGDWKRILDIKTQEKRIAVPFLGEILNWVFGANEYNARQGSASYVYRAMESIDKVPALVQEMIENGGDASHLEGIDLKEIFFYNKHHVTFLQWQLNTGDYYGDVSDDNFALGSSGHQIVRYSAKNFLLLMSNAAPGGGARFEHKGSYSVPTRIGGAEAWRNINFVELLPGAAGHSPLSLSSSAKALPGLYKAMVRGGMTLGELEQGVKRWGIAGSSTLDDLHTEEIPLAAKAVKHLRRSNDPSALVAWMFFCARYAEGDVSMTKAVMAQFGIEEALLLAQSVGSAKPLIYMTDSDMDFDLAHAIAG